MNYLIWLPKIWLSTSKSWDCCCHFHASPPRGTITGIVVRCSVLSATKFIHFITVDTADAKDSRFTSFVFHGKHQVYAVDQHFDPFYRWEIVTTHTILSHLYIYMGKYDSAHLLFHKIYIYIYYIYITLTLVIFLIICSHL